MFHKILIANRGEIALRVIRACKELSIKSVVVYSEADADTLPVRFADEAICIGPVDHFQSYLNEANILSAAEITGADAIHPGYGYLAESAHFAEVCETCGIKFIGPKPESIRLMGDKVQARNLVVRQGIPVIDGSSGPIVSLVHGLSEARRLGFPVMLKAAAGGGGRGIRIIQDQQELRESLEVAKAEAVGYFGSGQIYLERFLAGARHIEVQVFGDSARNVMHFGERDCTIQRRHQKLVEEAPSTFVTSELRNQMTEAALAICRLINYENAGTIEFLVTPDKQFYFMEMNTRIQVEHPVTEMVTGVNLIKEQIRVAAGQALDTRLNSVTIRGHSIECRICAEDPVTMKPSSGKIEVLNLPGGLGVRVDTAAFVGCHVSRYYDSMIAKLIVHGENRDEAIARMKRCLEEFIVIGIETNIGLLATIISSPEFRSGMYDTQSLTLMKLA